MLDLGVIETSGGAIFSARSTDTPAAEVTDDPHRRPVYGVTEDYKQAVTWYQKSADQGDAKAEKNLGDMYFFGRGVDLDYRLALVWYGKAADQQFADAQFRLGYMYEKGLGVTADEKAALDLYKKAASNGSVEAQRAIDRLNRGQ